MSLRDSQQAGPASSLAHPFRDAVWLWYAVVLIAIVVGDSQPTQAVVRVALSCGCVVALVAATALALRNGDSRGVFERARRLYGRPIRSFVRPVGAVCAAVLLGAAAPSMAYVLLACAVVIAPVAILVRRPTS